MKKIVVNKCFGGFGLSDLAYEELIKLGVPVRKYIQEIRNPKTGLYEIKEKSNEGKVIFDRELTPIGESSFTDLYHKSKGQSLMSQRYWEVWIDKERENPLLIQIVEKLGEKANGSCANLRIIEIPDEVDYVIEEYDGLETVAEKHRIWE